MHRYTTFGSLERREAWVRWRRWLYAVVINSLRVLLVKCRRWFPNTITFRGIKVSNRPAHLSDEVFSALMVRLYERSEFACLKRLDKSYQPIIELGGSSGVVGCALSKQLVPARHIIVEANPTLIPVLRYHLQLNGITKCVVLNKAIVASENDRLTPVRFSSGSGSLVGHVDRGDAQGDFSEVEGITLAALYRDEIGEGSFTLFCDIEGMEVECLLHPEAREVLKKIDQAIIEFHAVEQDGMVITPEQSAANFAAAAGLEATFRHSYVWLFKRPKQ